MDWDNYEKHYGEYQIRFRERAEELYNEVNFGDVTTYLKGLLGVEGLDIKYELKWNRSNEPYVQVSSNNLIEHATLMKFICKEVYVENFGGSIHALTGEGSVDYTQDYPLVIRLPLSFHYVHHSGGTNGYSLAYAVYDQRSGSWDIEADMDSH